MLARGLVAVSLAVTGASALTKNCRPESSTTLAIWPLARGAKTVGQTISVARTSHAAFAVRFTIVPWGKPTTIQQFSNLLQSGQSLISPRPGQGQYPFGTRNPAEQPAEIARPWLILRIPGRLSTARHGFWQYPDYNKGSRREGTLNKALFRAAVS